MKIGILIVPNSDLVAYEANINRLNILKKEYVEWSNSWEITATGDIFPDVARYNSDPIPRYNLKIINENGNITLKTEPR